jgi:PAS domain S-box-containing protein
MLLIFIIPALSASNTEVEELEKKIGTAEGKEKVDILISLSRSFVPRDPGKALSYAQQAYNLSKNINYKQGETEALGKIGNSYYQIGDYQKCLDYHYKSLELALKIKYFKQVKKSYNVIGVTYRKLGSLEKAVEMYLKVLEIQEISPDVDFRPSVVYNNLGNIYADQKKYTKAAEFYEKALKSTKKKETRHRSLLLINLGVIYTHLEKYDIALKFLFEALELCKTDGRTIHAAFALNIIGKVYTDTKQYSRAKSHLEQALKLAKKANARAIIMEIYETHWLLYSKTENFKKAFEFLKLYWELKDRLFNEKKSKQISEMRVKFDSERKEKENTILQKNLKIQQMKLETQKKMRNFIIILLAISLLLIIVIANRYRVKQKSNRLLTEKNKTITQQQKELKKAFTDLSHSEQKIRAIFDNAGVGIGVVNKEGQFITMNSKWPDMLGVSPEEILSKTFLEFSHPDDRSTSQGYFKSLLNGDINQFHLQVRYRHTAGHFFWGDLTATPILSLEGRPESVIFMVTDISDRKAAEFALRESEEKYRSLVENSSYGIVIALDNTIKFANSQFEYLSGCSHEDLIDSNLSNHIEPVPPSGYKKRSKGKEKFDTVLVSKTGQRVDVEVHISEIYYGERFADLLFIHDITEKKLLEQERIKNRELEFKESLMAKLTKYFEDVMNKLIKSIDLISPKEKDYVQIQEILQGVEHSSTKILEFSQTLFSLSRKQPDLINRLDLQEKIEEWTRQRALNAGFTIEANIPDHLWTVDCNPKQIQLVVTELLDHSMKLSGPGRTLKLAAENLAATEDRFKDLSKGRYVKLSLTFQGKADQQALESTDNFFLSFALAYAIVKKHNGVIYLQTRSTVNDFNSFEIYLPAYRHGLPAENKHIEGL